MNNMELLEKLKGAKTVEEMRQIGQDLKKDLDSFPLPPRYTKKTRVVSSCNWTCADWY